MENRKVTQLSLTEYDLYNQVFKKQILEAEIDDIEDRLLNTDLNNLADLADPSQLSNGLRNIVKSKKITLNTLLKETEVNPLLKEIEVNTLLEETEVNTLLKEIANYKKDLEKNITQIGTLKEELLEIKREQKKKLRELHKQDKTETNRETKAEIRKQINVLTEKMDELDDKIKKDDRELDRLLTLQRTCTLIIESLNRIKKNEAALKNFEISEDDRESIIIIVRKKLNALSPSLLGFQKEYERCRELLKIDFYNENNFSKIHSLLNELGLIPTEEQALKETVAKLRAKVSDPKVIKELNNIEEIAKENKVILPLLIQSVVTLEAALDGKTSWYDCEKISEKINFEVAKRNLQDTIDQLDEDFSSLKKPAQSVLKQISESERRNANRKGAYPLLMQGIQKVHAVVKDPYNKTAKSDCQAIANQLGRGLSKGTGIVTAINSMLKTCEKMNHLSLAEYDVLPHAFQKVMTLEKEIIGIKQKVMKSMDEENLDLSTFNFLFKTNFILSDDLNGNEEEIFKQILNFQQERTEKLNEKIKENAEKIKKLDEESKKLDTESQLSLIQQKSRERNSLSRVNFDMEEEIKHLKKIITFITPSFQLIKEKKAALEKLKEDVDKKTDQFFNKLTHIIMQPIDQNDLETIEAPEDDYTVNLESVADYIKTKVRELEDNITQGGFVLKGPSTLDAFINEVATGWVREAGKLGWSADNVTELKKMLNGMLKIELFDISNEEISVEEEDEYSSVELPKILNQLFMHYQYQKQYQKLFGSFYHLDNKQKFADVNPLLKQMGLLPHEEKDFYVRVNSLKGKCIDLTNNWVKKLGVISYSSEFTSFKNNMSLIDNALTDLENIAEYNKLILPLLIEAVEKLEAFADGNGSWKDYQQVLKQIEFKQMERSLQDSIDQLDDESPLKQPAQNVLNEMSETGAHHLNRKEVYSNLMSGMKAVQDVVNNPYSGEAHFACRSAAMKFEHGNKRIWAGLMVVAGVAMILASVAFAVSTFGVGTGPAIIGGIVGTSLLIGGLGAAGIAFTGIGSSIFHKYIPTEQTAKVKDALDVMLEERRKLRRPGEPKVPAPGTYIISVPVEKKEEVKIDFPVRNTTIAMEEADSRPKLPDREQAEKGEYPVRNTIPMAEADDRGPKLPDREQAKKENVVEKVQLDTSTFKMGFKKGK